MTATLKKSKSLYRSVRKVIEQGRKAVSITAISQAASRALRATDGNGAVV